MKRMHNSHTKLMIMSVVPERPISADSATRALRAYQKDIDYFSSALHEKAKEQREKLKQRKLRSKRTTSIEGINEVGEGEEEDPRAQSGMGSFEMDKSLNKFTESNMNLMQEKLNSSFVFDE